MELDELKKSWNALNEQLQKEPIADEQQITELIAGYKANTRKSLGRLVVIQRKPEEIRISGCYECRS